MLVAMKETRESDAAHPAAALEALLPEIRQRRKEFEKQQHISPDIIQRFKEVGVYRALVAKRFGGDEKSPAEFCQLIERIAEADGSAGWVASFGIGGVYLAALPLATLEKLYANGPDVVFAGDARTRRGQARRPPRSCRSRPRGGARGACDHPRGCSRVVSQPALARQGGSRRGCGYWLRHDGGQNQPTRHRPARQFAQSAH